MRLSVCLAYAFIWCVCLLPSFSVFLPVCEYLLPSLPSQRTINQPGLLSPIILRTFAFEISADGLGPRPAPRAAQATQPAGGSTRGGCQVHCPVPICADARPAFPRSLPALATPRPQQPMESQAIPPLAGEHPCGEEVCATSPTTATWVPCVVHPGLTTSKSEQLCHGKRDQPLCGPSRGRLRHQTVRSVAASME